MSEDMAFSNEEIGELIEFLRKEGLDPCDDAADLIEAQAAEISELREKVKELEENNCRYQYIRNNYQWRREGKSVTDRDAQGLIVVAVPYLSNLDCAASMDFVIDKLLSTRREEG